MSIYIIDKKVKELSDEIAVNSFKKVEYYFPIDRFFLEKYEYINKISSVDSLQFLYHNFERVNNTYTVQLMYCLPELWKEITYENLTFLINHFTNSFSYYAFIKFTYKYLKIDLLDDIFLNENVDRKIKLDCLSYFKEIAQLFYIDEDDIIASEENLIGIKIDEWDLISKRLHLNHSFVKSLDYYSLLEKLRMYEKVVM